MSALCSLSFGLVQLSSYLRRKQYLVRVHSSRTRHAKETARLAVSELCPAVHV